MKKIGLGIAILLFAIIISLCSSGMGLLVIGIGLHLAREIVTLHQGTLKVVDRSGLEEATTFQLCAQLRVCSQAGGIPVYPRFSQPDNSESWDDAGNGI